MPYKYSSLPEYPVKKDMWDLLAEEKRPIVVYGMGNGADKLFARLEKYGVGVSDVFASDGFVRGHSFRGYQVLSFSDIKEKYDDFVILLSFASSREDVIEMLEGIGREYDMYVPDMPVAGEEEYFDKEFYNANYEHILRAYNSLADEDSRNCFASVVNYKLTGEMRYLLDTYSERDEIYAEIGIGVRCVIDGGAYNGDTLREAVRYFPSLERVVAVEPDPKTFKRLLKTAATVEGIEVQTVNAALWDKSGAATFSASGNRNSSINSTSSYEHIEGQTVLCTVDELGQDPDYIKYDVEGAEYEALLGSVQTISKSRPVLLVSLYHRSRDLFFLIEYIAEKYPFYRLVLRRLKCLPAWEIDLIAVHSDII